MDVMSSADPRRIADCVSAIRAVAAQCVETFIAAEGAFFEDATLGLTQSVTDEQLAEAGHPDVTAESLRTLRAAYEKAKPTLGVLAAASVLVSSRARRP